VDTPAPAARGHPASCAVELKIAAAPSALPLRTAHIVNRGWLIIHGVPQAAERMDRSKPSLDLIDAGG
jgi:hypothetical protein